MRSRVRAGLGCTAAAGLLLLGGWGDGPQQKQQLVPELPTTTAPIARLAGEPSPDHPAWVQDGPVPGSWFEGDGNLRVDCDSPAVLCDDEGS